MPEFLQAEIKTLKKIISKMEKKIAKMEGDPDSKPSIPDHEEPVLPSRHEKALRIAALEIGQKEVSGSGNNSRVVEYHRYASKNNKVEQPDSVPWCSSFVCYVVEKAGMGSTNSMMARSWLKWGESVKKDPRPGDIVVYWRGNKSGWKGHVGIYLRTNRDGSIVTLGGNQSDEVNVTAYNSSKLLDIRRSRKSRSYNDGDKSTLEFLAHSIINGRTIASNGKVV